MLQQRAKDMHQLQQFMEAQQKAAVKEAEQQELDRKKKEWDYFKEEVQQAVKESIKDMNEHKETAKK